MISTLVAQVFGVILFTLAGTVTVEMFVRNTANTWKGLAIYSLGLVSFAANALVASAILAPAMVTFLQK